MFHIQCPNVLSHTLSMAYETSWARSAVLVTTRTLWMVDVTALAAGPASPAKHAAGQYGCRQALLYHPCTRNEWDRRH